MSFLKDEEMRRKTNLKSLLAASAIVVVVIAGQAAALKYPPDAPDFAGCENSGYVFWEFVDDYCLPTTDEDCQPYYYDPGPADDLTFGSRHYDDPFPGWGGSYGADPWTWSDGIFTVLAEDAITQPIPERGQKQYLRQYFQVVHTLVPGLDESDPRWPIGFAVELWDMSVNGWTGCPQGYETDDGYLGGYEFEVPPEIHYEIPGAPGWYKSVWIHDFSTDGSVYSGEYEKKFEALYDTTHTACIVGMDLEPDQGEIFQIEEVILNFIWFDDPCGNDIPTDPAGSIIGTSSVQIEPLQPSSSDEIAITLSGEWSNSCTPSNSFVWITGDEINFEVIPRYSCGCLLVIAPWELTDYVGPLPSGSYTVYGYMYRDPCSPVSDPYTFVVSDNYYVNAVDGDDLNDGLSWETAFATIQKGIDTADNCDKVLVADGTYTGPGNRDLDFLGKAITVKSANGPENCIILCNFEGRGFYFHNDEDASSVADGFTIVAGKEYWDPCYPVPISTYGGGIYCEGSPTIRNCIISDSDASFGGGIYCENSPTIINCLIYNNSGVNGAGIWYSTNTKILNCTIVDNSGVNSGGVDGMNGQVTNSIIWGNVPNQIDGNPTVRYSDIQGGYSGTGNIDANPLFVDAPSSDYHLSVDSSCIDVGDNSVVDPNDTDLDGNPRIVSSTVDMGAYESQANIYYVDDDANGVDDGSSWANAYRDLHNALDDAVSGDEIWVAAGTYYPSVEVGGSGDRYKTFQMTEHV